MSDNKVYTKESPMKVFKMLHADGSAPWGTGKWPMPGPGDSYGGDISVVGDLVICQNGLHGFSDLLSLVVEGLYSCALWEAELWGDYVVGQNKVAFRHGHLCRQLVGWNDTTARLYAADCAERALPAFESLFSSDPRPRLAIAAARRMALGMDYNSAAESAAESAAWSAAESAAWSAAESAAWSAAESAARYAARYAAWSAAEYAAWSDAWSAARYAARYAAWSAAESAAWSAAHKWQAQRLHDYAYGLVDIDAIRKELNK